MTTAPPPSQTLSRLLIPIGSTSQQTTWVIPAIGNGVLRPDLTLHVGAVIVKDAATSYPAYDPLLGGWALVAEITIEDAEGRRLFNLKNANRYAQLALCQQSMSYNADKSGEECLTRRALQLRDPSIAGGQLYNGGPPDLPTTSAATTARVALDLRRICPLLANEIPLLALRELRITVLWEQSTSHIFDNPTQVTSFTIDRPALTYSVRIGGPPPPSSLQLMYEEPLSCLQTLPAGGSAYQVLLGGAGQRVTRLAVAVVDNPAAAITAAPLDKTARVNITVNGRPQYPAIGLGNSSCLNELDRAFGPFSLPIGAYLPGLDGINASGEGDALNTIAGSQSFMGFNLKPIGSLPGSIVNCLMLDTSGCYLNVSGRVTDTTQKTIYGWLMVPRVLSLADGMVAGLV